MKNEQKVTTIPRINAHRKNINPMATGASWFGIILINPEKSTAILVNLYYTQTR